MLEEFVMLAKQPPSQIANSLREIGEEEIAHIYDNAVSSGQEAFFAPKPYLNSQHQYGFIPIFEPGSQRYHKITAANNVEPDLSLQKQPINIRLDWLHIEEYPRIWRAGDTTYTIIFNFEARNQVSKGTEPLAFNQTYQVRSKQAAAVSGKPIFIGLNVGKNGVEFVCKTINVGNNADERLMMALTSDASASGLNLLTTVQPGLTPFVGMARQLCLLMANRKKNVPVQEIPLGLDFDRGAPGARLAIGSYIIVQVPSSNSIIWSDWSYDSETNSIVKTNLANEEESIVLPYNTIVFRVSKYQS